MPTIWEVVTGWWKQKFNPPPPEPQHYNPLNVNFKERCNLTIDVLDFRDKAFVVQNAVEYKVAYDKKSFNFTDYYCKATLQDGDVVKIRVYPHDSPGRDLQVLVLKQWDEVEYDEEFKELLDDEEFDTSIDGKVEAEFYRINNVKKPYQGTIVEFGEDHNGEVEFWDYWRDVKDETGVDFKEFLFVEWDKSNTGKFTIWRGVEVPRNRIFV
jgi:hypothetical protein